jgi:uncharacterized protein (TIGR00299 family) protein
MRILIYDPFAGISGDMHIGAMVDLGVPREYLIETLETLNLDGWKLSFTAEKRKGITAVRAIVETEDRPASYSGDGDETEHHHHDSRLNGVKTQHEHHHHDLDHEKGTDNHAHRTLVDIKKILSGSRLPSAVKMLAEKIFLNVARAEGKVHGKPLDEVHFHEVGAIDSIVDIVAAAAAIDYLKPDRILSFPPQLGGGFVRCAHGLMPVPAPATVEILTGIPTRMGAADYETTTPTGAAIRAAAVDEFIVQTDAEIQKIGYGAGSRDGSLPNVLRVYLAEESGKLPENKQEIIRIETAIDDMSAEILAHVCDLVRKAGAKDVWMSSALMKKGRPGTIITIMTSREDEEAVCELLFRETTTAGVHSWPIDQTALEREIITAATPYGPVRIKKFFRRGALVSWKAEYEDVKALASKHQVSIKQIYGELEV